MKKIIGFLAILFFAQPVYAAVRPCVQAEYDGFVQMAENQGYRWTGKLETCTADENPGYAQYWSAPAARGVMMAILQNNPDRMQFKSGGTIDLFCMMVRDGRWVGVGKTCPR
jgi:hypothetical protein